ncbi:MAG: BTAD domain-containing putative transcriptional regulator [Pseudomonadales bacterium]|jgi:DNA-binding SARP family transcriptional activator|nr:BTAD domain-containing putative transcriptional regulator [Pseudomonadales bacterium]
MSGQRSRGLHVRLLGPLDAFLDGRPVALPRSRKARALLAYLAATRRPHSRTALGRLLFGRTSDPRSSLRWVISRLRTAFGEDGSTILRSDDDRIVLTPDATTDLAELQRLAEDHERRDAGTIQAFLGAVQGEFLEGLELPREAEFEAWRIGQSATCSKLLAGLLKERLRHAAGAAETVALSQQLVAIAPADEDAWALLVAGQKRLGRREDARRTFLLARQHLQQEGVTASGRLRSALEEADVRRPGRGTRPVIALLPLDGQAEPDAVARARYRAGLRRALWRCGGCELVDDPDGQLVVGRADFGIRARIARTHAGIELDVILIDGGTGTTIFEWSLEIEGRDPATIEARMAARLASRFELDLVLAQILHAQAKPDAARTPRDRFHLALASIYAAEGYDAQDTLNVLARIVDADPSIAGAHCAMAWVRTTHPDHNHDPGEIARSARLARHAVDLAGRDPFVVAWAAVVITHTEQDPGTAAALVERALGVNPDSPMALIASAWIGHYRGRYRESLAQLDRLEELHAAGPLEFFAHGCRAMAHYQLGEIDRAIDFARRAVGLNPGFIVPLRYLAASLARAGRAEEAREVMKRMLALDRSEHLSFFRAYSPYTDAAALERLCEDLAAAGMPEHAPD